MKHASWIAPAIALTLATLIGLASPVASATETRPGKCTGNVCVIRDFDGDTIIETTNYYILTSSGWVLQQSITRIYPRDPVLQ